MAAALMQKRHILMKMCWNMCWSVGKWDFTDDKNWLFMAV
jgi:hypothetical protein